jgi:structural maintenance of chromosome 3 (chondroitin sulfate proteoglycan 6)
MTETNNKREQINELLEYIEKRLEELEEEKRELAEYQKADKERRCLEYALYFREQNEALNQLEDLEQERLEEQEQTVERYKHLSDRMVIIQELEQELEEEKQRLELLLIEKQQIDEDIQDVIKSKALLALTIQDLDDTVSDVTKQRSQLMNEKNQLQKQIKEKQKELSKVVPQFEKALEQETNEKSSLSDLQTELDALSAKQGRYDRFKSASERDAWLNQSILDSKGTLNTLNEQCTLLERSRERNSGELTKFQREVEKLSAENDASRAELQSIEANLEQKRREKDQAESEKKNLWREEAKVVSKLESLRQSSEKVSRELLSTMDRNTSKALKAVPKIVERLGLRGYHGPVFDLFQVDEALQTAVEVVGGNSLFHIVVDTDETASAILNVLNHEKAGRVTFMPLNRLRPKEVTYPESDRAIPLLSRLEYDSRFHPVMLQIFGKAIIAPSLEEASTFAKSHNLTGVTFEGDRADRKGALTGGFVDYKRSRLGTVKMYQQVRTQEHQLQKELERVQSSIRTKEQTVLRLRDEVQELEQQQRVLSSSRLNALQEAHTKSNQLQSLEITVEQQDKHIQGLRSTIENIRQEIVAFESELGTPLRKNLDSNEMKRVQVLPGQIKQLQDRVSQLVVTRTRLEAEKVQAEIMVETHLSRRLEELEQALERLASTGSSNQKLSSQQQELQELEGRLETLTQKRTETEENVEDGREKIVQQSQRLEKAKVVLIDVGGSN